MNEEIKNRDLSLELAKLIGEPINPQLPVPFELSLIADTFTAEPGEHVWRYSALDTYTDDMIDVDTNGVITVIKRSPLHDVELTFKGMNSPLDYVLVEDILNKVDTNALARRKAAIARGMDKREVKLILDAILNPAAAITGYNSALNSSVYPSNYQQNDADTLTGANHSVQSGDDLYDVILKAKHAIEDYGDKYVLLAGRTVKEKIDTYDKDRAATLRYNVTLTAKLRELGIEVYKIYGQVNDEVGAGPLGNESGSTDVTSLLDPNKFILIAQDSRVAEGKPVKFVRRAISADIAKQMGAEVDSFQRVLIVNPTPVQQVISGTRQSVLAYGVFGYESVIFFIANPLAIYTADCTNVFANDK
jgi:hypothetical protein